MIAWSLSYFCSVWLDLSAALSAKPSILCCAVASETVSSSSPVASGFHRLIMSEQAAQFLREVYSIPSGKIDIIPHGVPDFQFMDPNYFKDRFGAEGKSVLRTQWVSRLGFQPRRPSSPGTGIPHRPSPPALERPQCRSTGVRDREPRPSTRGWRQGHPLHH
jgi:hypothetical protein